MSFAPAWLWLLASIVSVQPEATPAPGVSAEILELARAVTPRVEAIRGRRFKREVAMKIVDDEMARQHFEQRATKLWPREEIEHDQRALAQLGLLPEGTSLLDALLDLLEEQAGGYYDPETDTFYVLDDIPEGTASILIAHELTHALDDQHFDIDALLENAMQNDDRSAALSAVIEGSGTLVMSKFMVEEIRAGRLSAKLLEELEQSEAGRAELLRAAPAYLQRGLLASYALGTTFLLRGDPARIRRRVSGEDIDRAFSEPPHSTRQILHPNLYWGDEPLAAVAISLPDLSTELGGAWELVSSGQLGELNMALLVGGNATAATDLDATDSSQWTSPAAAGLTADVYHHYAQGLARVTVLLTRWEDPAEAAEFRKALTPVAGRRTFHGGATVALVAGSDAATSARVAAAALSRAQLEWKD